MRAEPLNPPTRPLLKLLVLALKLLVPKERTVFGLEKLLNVVFGLEKLLKVVFGLTVRPERIVFEVPVRNLLELNLVTLEDETLD